MKLSKRFKPLVMGLCVASTVVIANSEAAVVRINQGAFTPQAGLITFSEFSVGTVNPTYTPANYGGGAAAPTVKFGGWFTGQSGGVAGSCPSGAALSGCVLGSPTGVLSIDSASPETFITTDSANPTSPVLTGSPRFNGPIAVLFDKDLAGVGLDGGFFDAIGGTAITAFDRNGNLIGSVKNGQTGIEFLGLVTDNGQASIAGLLFSLVGGEPAGFAIDNLRFGVAGQVVVPGAVPLPAALPLLASVLGLGVFVRSRKNS